MHSDDLNAYHPGGQVSGFPAHKLSVLEPGRSYEGRVGLPLPHQNLVEVQLQGFDRVEPCIWIAGYFSGLLGLSSSFVPPEGTRVLVHYTGRDYSYIVGAWPSTRTTVEDRSMIGGDAVAAQTLFQAAQARASDLRSPKEHQPPVDLLPGELDLTNAHGVGITLLRHLASLQAGDLARVECHLLDDLVRIVSQNYKHHSAIGDHTITNDHGRLNAIWHAAARDHETWGQMKGADQRVEVKGETEVAKPAAGADAEGRWRYSQFLGWLGDFVHIFVTDPVAQLGQLAESAVRAGRFRAHVNSDGSLLVQSVADIVLEKVVAIPVPIQLRREDDPEGEQVPNQDELVPSPVDNNWKPATGQPLFEMAFQLREYSRWLNNQLAFARFRQMPRDWKVPTEEETANAKVADAKLSTKWVQAYACIRIYRDGSVQSLDAYGNAVTMTAVGVQVSSTRDILLQAAGSVNIVAGRDVNIRSQRNLTANSDTGDVSLKGQGLQLMASSDNLLLSTVEGRCAYVDTDLRLGSNFEVTKFGNLKCQGLASFQSVSVTGSLRAGYLSHSTVLIGGYAPHMNHVGIGGGLPFFLLPVSGRTTFSFPDASQYGPPGSTGKFYEPISESMLKRNEISSDGIWDLGDPYGDGQGQPWPGQMVYCFTDGGTSLKTPSTEVKFAAQPKAMQTNESPAIHYRL